MNGRLSFIVVHHYEKVLNLPTTIVIAKKGRVSVWYS